MEETIDALKAFYTEPAFDYLAELKIDDKLINLEQLSGRVKIDKHEIQIPFKISSGFETFYGEFRRAHDDISRFEFTFVNFNRNVLSVLSNGIFSRLNISEYGVGTLVFKVTGHLDLKVQSDCEEISYFL